MPVTGVRSKWSSGNLIFYEDPGIAGKSIQFGEDASGLDVKFMGATTGAFMFWDEANDKLIFDKADIQLGDSDELRFGDLAAGDIVFKFNGSDFSMVPNVNGEGFLIGTAAKQVNITQHGTYTVGVDDTGYDVKLFGATASAYLLWDESEDALTFAGASQLRLGTSGAKLTGVTTEFALSAYVTMTAGQSEGLCAYFEGHLAGALAGHTYNVGSWINVDTGATLTAGLIVTPFEGGVWTGEAQATARIVFAGQYQAILDGAPDSLHAWRLNTTQTIDALIAAANAGSVGYAASGTTNSSKVGDLPLADVVGHGVRYVRLYDAAG